MVCRYQNTKYGCGFRIFHTSFLRKSNGNSAFHRTILNLFSLGICAGRGIYMASECLSSSNSFFVETLFFLWDLALGQHYKIMYLCYGGKI